MSDLKHRMEGALSALKTDFNGLRTGRASPDLLAPVMVEAYGSAMPLNQVGSVNVADARSLTISVWDKGLVAATEKAIRDAGLGLNPSVDGQTIRINLPELNEQRRQELVKLARKYAEDARIAMRNVRRDGMDTIKKDKDDGLGEDDAKREMDKVEKLTTEMVAQVDALLASKEKDITTV
jgi:ribosome recycling factor